MLMKMTDIPGACHFEELLAALQTTYTVIIQPQLNSTSGAECDRCLIIAGNPANTCTKKEAKVKLCMGASGEN